MNLENKKQIAIIAMAVGLGLVAVILTGNHIQSSIKRETAVLAKQAEKARAADRKRIDLLQKQIEALRTKQIQTAKQIGSTRVVKSSPEIPKSSLALRTPPGKRAMTIRIDSLSAVGGLINPGDYVDILSKLTIPPPPGSKEKSEKVTAILFQNLQVLAVGTNLQATGGYAAQQASASLNITFALDPEEAGLMAFARDNGKFRLILRSPTETETQMLQIASWDALADYVLDKHGMDLIIPKQSAIIQAIPSFGPTEEIKPAIQIFRGNREL